MVTVWSIFLSIVFLLAVPLCLGFLWCDSLNIRKSFASLYVFGMFVIWAYSQLILVPMILADVSFAMASIVFLFVTVVLILLFIYRFYRANRRKDQSYFKRFSIADVPVRDRICFALLAAVVLFIIIHGIALQHTDADDSRFVVLSMDTVRSDRMLRINPATGEVMDGYIGEMSKDFSSPWPVYTAVISYLCGVKSSIMIHSVFPVFLYLLVTCAFWLLADLLFAGRFSMKCLFVALTWFITVFSNYSELNAESFIMLRIWQGKAIVAGLTIPMLLYCFINIYKEATWKNWMNLLLVNLGSCLLSGNGIVIGAIMICSYGFVYSILHKKYNLLLYSLILCIPNFVFYMVNQNALLFL